MLTGVCQRYSVCAVSNSDPCCLSCKELPCTVTASCEPEYLRCKEGVCLHPSLVCDGLKHCTDGDDELNCERTDCTVDEFACSGRCVPWSRVCDGHSDCADRSDESPTKCAGRWRHTCMLEWA